MNTCLNCNFWRPDSKIVNRIGVSVPADHKDANPSGFCVFNPPVPSSLGWRIYPRTIDDDECGKHQPGPVRTLPQPTPPPPSPAPKPTPVVAAPAPMPQTPPPTTKAPAVSRWGKKK